MAPHNRFSGLGRGAPVGWRLTRVARACTFMVGALPPLLGWAQSDTGTAQPVDAARPVAQGAQASPALTITVTGLRAQQPLSLGGFGNQPLSQLPLSATVVTRQQLADAGISDLGDLTRLNASTTDAYDAPGYIPQIAVRGFVLDNRFNFRRDGLPINAETRLGHANKQALELLLGTSGLLAGTSSPGGLVNLVVKRPVGRIRQAGLAWVQDGSIEATADLGDRSDADGAWGWRVNVAGQRLDPQTRGSRGHSGLAAAAVEWRPAPSTRLEAEIELSQQSQPSTPGFSLLGNTLPAATAIDPRINLNHQPWTTPVVLAGSTGSLRASHVLDGGTELTAHVARQALRSDDRVAFPYGCSAENRYDRYCSDGSFDLYDYRSDGERRTTDALELAASGTALSGGLGHQWRVALLTTRHSARFNRQAYNWVGVGHVTQPFAAPADPSLTDENTQRDERSTELSLQDSVALTPALTAWAGLRHSRIDRRSVRTDGSRATAYQQSVTAPWLALSHSLHKSSRGQTLVYASWGEGVESEVTPNRARYANAGEALPALKSRQAEAGIKHRQGSFGAQVSVFQISRPAWNDYHLADRRLAQDDCSNADPCVRRADGSQRHRGIEIEADATLGSLSLRGSALWMQARRQGATDTALNGLLPTNVPERSAKLQAAWNLRAVPGLALLAYLTHEGRRMVLPDNSVSTPGWTKVDLGARYVLKSAHQTWVWRAAVDNAAGRRAWQEAAYQYGHAYLYPLPPRTWRVSADVTF